MPFPDFNIPKAPQIYPLEPPPNKTPKLPIQPPQISPDTPNLDTRLNNDHSLVGMTGGQIVAEMFTRHNVEHIFSISGGAVIPILDALHKHPTIDLVQPRHEQCGGHMAEGYARVSGKPGIVLVTSGPGATNMVTPLQDALSDGVPLVVICGQVRTSLVGTDSFQETDMIGISKPCTKWNHMVRTVEEIPRRINEAFEIATSGRPGPVLLEIPIDVGASVLKKPVSLKPVIPNLKMLALQNTVLRPTDIIAPNPLIGGKAGSQMQQRNLMATIERSAKLINMAKKPVIYAGHGVLSKEEGPILLRELAEKAQIPVTTTLHGLGCFDEDDEKSLHMLGMHGAIYANLAMQEADCIIALGARFDDRATGNVAEFAPAAKEAAAKGKGGIIHFEIQPKNINKVVEVTEAVEGDLSANLELLLPLIDGVRSRKDWLGRIKELKAQFPLSNFNRAPESGLLSPQFVIEELSRLTEPYKDQVIITTGVGQHQMWTAQHYKWKHPRTIVTSGGLGTMGFGLPSAIGAKLAQPNKIVIDIDGDASFQMTLMELKTAALYNLGVKIIIFNNDESGMVSQWQSMFLQDRFTLAHHENPDFVKVAEGMGVKAIRVSRADQLEDALTTMLEYDGPILLDAVIDRKVALYPMVAPGKGLSEYLAYDEAAEKERRALLKKRTGY
ncbi:Acetolactate synthase, mitochondrial [Arthrobotrys musiformis]|uniref:Acetolactate synthase n=1 Tax=Arthrobotrys musiformis TaxID=47236 RepID=A0AAV9W7T3_9PEZI